jgi:hypothetical protein
VPSVTRRNTHEFVVLRQSESRPENLTECTRRARGKPTWTRGGKRTRGSRSLHVLGARPSRLCSRFWLYRFRTALHNRHEPVGSYIHTASSALCPTELLRSRRISLRTSRDRQKVFVLRISFPDVSCLTSLPISPRSMPIRICE